jgi:hypothetical protein
VIDAIVFGTIAASVLCWAVGECTGSRVAWTLGAALALVHAVSAFVVFYEGSYEMARVATMRQTEALTGVRFTGGIYINYVFLATWLLDAAWWWLSPASRAERPRAVDAGIRGFIFFIMVNGAVVFADGLARGVGLVAVIAVAACWMRRARR